MAELKENAIPLRIISRGNEKDTRLINSTSKQTKRITNKSKLLMIGESVAWERLKRRPYSHWPPNETPTAIHIGVLEGAHTRSSSSFTRHEPIQKTDFLQGWSLAAKIGA
jgi:hypothetical protein